MSPSPSAPLPSESQHSHGPENSPEHLPPLKALQYATIALLACSALALQTRINAALATQVDDGFVAALVSFGGGLVILLVMTAFSRPNQRALHRLNQAVRERRLPAWFLIAGAMGAWLVTTQGLVASALGVAMFMIALITGQTVGGLVVDRTGFAGGLQRRLTPTRLACAAITIGAVVWAVSGRSDLTGGSHMIWAALLPFSAGLLLSFQQAMNGRIAVAATAPFAATFTNFLVGTLVLIVVTGARRIIADVPLIPAMPGQWWMYTGGALGIVFIFTGAKLVPHIGVLRFTIASVSGQLIGSLVLDIVWPTAGAQVTVSTVGGTLLTLAAVGLSTLQGASSRSASA